MDSNKFSAATPDTTLRPSFIEVDLNRLTENYRAIKNQVGSAIVMPIVKANAYGHGLIRISEHLVCLGAEILGVAFVEEALILRRAGLKIPILVLGGVLGEQIPLYLKNDLKITASSVDKLKQIDQIAGEMGIRAKVHLKIDTGMERIGVHYYSAGTLLEASLKVKNTVVEGIFSHFANADAADLSDARVQIQRFEEVLSFYEKRNLPTPIRHMANSGGVLQLPESYYDLVRPGILMYGVYPSNEVIHSIAVNPLLSWKSKVVYFKVVKPNHAVSYGSIWKSEKMVRVVTIPVGYGDGYFRSMTEKAQIILRGERYPVVGRICMDQFMVNIDWDSAYIKDEVMLVGESSGQKITVEDLANWAGTIPYEILTNINTRVPRVYIQK